MTELLKIKLKWKLDIEKLIQIIIKYYSSV